MTLDFSKLVQPGERPLAAYERLAASGVLRRDDAQRSAIAVLDRLHRTLETNRGGEETPPPPPSPKREGSWFADLFGGPPPRESSAARRDQNQPHAGGVYLHGGPGCGKTFCMDLAYACLPGAPGVGKRREHFHSFMLETHVKLHELGKLSKGAGTRDTVATYAREVARDARVLCLDEFQVTDVADAMIIRRLLDQLWARGVTLVTTSNRAPTDLYKNGLNRPQFVPCIEAIEARCDVHEMRSDVDYRLTGHALVGAEEDEEEEEDDVETNTSRRSSSSVDRRTTWKVIDSSDPEAHAKADAWLSRRCERLAKGEKMVRVEVALGGRRVDVAKAGGGVAHLQFDDVCASALGAGDYTALASVFHTVGLGGVPRMTTERADLMRRFITFVDVMYEHKVKLIATAPCAPRDLFDEGSRGGGRGGGGGSRGGGGSGASSSAGGVGSEKGSPKVGSPKKGSPPKKASPKVVDDQRDEAFAWDRCASRLAEMGAAEYVEAPWRPKSGAWLLEQARVTEVVPENVLRALWQRYDADHNGVLDEAELEELLADLNQMRRGHRHVPAEQLESAWRELTNRGRAGVAPGAGLGTVESRGGISGGAAAEGGEEKAMPSRRGDAFVAFEDFIKYGNKAFAACMLA